MSLSVVMHIITLNAFISGKVFTVVCIGPTVMELTGNFVTMRI